MTHRVLRRDEQGRPIEIEFDGDVARQCPACLSDQVEPFTPIHFFWVGDTDDMSPARVMHCLACGAMWWRPGV